MKYEKSMIVLLAAIAGVGLATQVLAVPPTPTTTSLTFSKNPAQVGDSVTVTATVDNAIPVGGKLRIKQLLVNDAPASCAAYNTAKTDGDASTVATEVLTELDPVNSGANTGVNTISVAGYTAAEGSYGYEAQYVPSGGSGYDQSQAACVDLVVNPVEVACVANASGLQIIVNESTGSASGEAGTTYVGGFKVKVSNCTENPIGKVTAQGGRSGWTTFTGALPGTLSENGTPAGCGTADIRNNNKKNEVVLWTIGTIAAGASCELALGVTGNIKAGTPVGTDLFLSGAWSAINGDTKVKSLYSDRAFITVVEPAP